MLTGRPDKYCRSFKQVEIDKFMAAKPKPRLTQVILVYVKSSYACK